MARPLTLWLMWTLGCGSADVGHTAGPALPDSDTGDLDAQRYSSDWDGVMALMTDRCVVCHQPGGGAELRLPEALEADLDSAAGALVVAGDPDASLLWRVVSDQLLPDDYGLMPLGALLPLNHTVHVRDWIDDGAPR